MLMDSIKIKVDKSDIDLRRLTRMVREYVQGLGVTCDVTRTKDSTRQAHNEYHRRYHQANKDKINATKREDYKRKTA